MDIEKGDVASHHDSVLSRRWRNRRSNRSPSAEWMAYLDDDVPMSAITIPGTHDSATFTRSWPFVSTQKMDIHSQLNAGIRYFDLRCGIRNDIVEMVHGPTFLGLTLHAVLDTMYSWLASHPTEALVVQIKRDKKEAKSTVEFAQAISDILSMKSERWCTANTTPSLGELRGRIQLLRRFDGPDLHAYGLNVTEWKDNPRQPFTIYTGSGVQITIQDHYSFPRPTTLPSVITKKGGAISRLLDRAASDLNDNHWYINFTSAFEFNLYYQLTPREIAVGGWWKFRWEEGINVRLREWLADQPRSRRRFGIVAMDFPEIASSDLVGALVLSNFEDEERSGLKLSFNPFLALVFSLVLTCLFAIHIGLFEPLLPGRSWPLRMRAFNDVMEAFG